MRKNNLVVGILLVISISMFLSYGVFAYSEYKGVAQAPNNEGYFAVGFTNSTGAGGYDLLLSKFDQNGNLISNVTYGGAGNDKGNSIISVYDGYVVSGETTSYGLGMRDLWALKFDLNGNLLWNKTYGRVNDDAGYSVVADIVNPNEYQYGYYFVGITNSSGAGKYDSLLVKFYSNGTKMFNKTYGGANNDYAYGITVVENQQVLLVGQTYSYGTNGELWYFKVSFSGTALTGNWSTQNKVIGGSGSDVGYSITRDYDGDYIIVGTTNSTGAGKEDIFAIKVDTSKATAEWNKTYGGALSDKGYYIQKGFDEKTFFIGGLTNSFGSGGSDAYYLKINSTGALLNNQTFGGINNESANSILKISNGGYLLFGNNQTGVNTNRLFIKTQIENNVPTTVSARINPLLPYTNNTLTGFCNSTDIENGRVDYYFRWYKNKVLNSTGFKKSYVYQENWNAVKWTPSSFNYSTNMYDGNWNTKGNTSASFKTLYPNYTMPIWADRTTLWRVKDNLGEANLTIDPQCWYLHRIAGVFQGYYWTTAIPGGNFECRVTASSANTLRRVGPITVREFYEDAIYWAVKQANEVNVSQIIVPYTRPGENWTFSCKANDGYFNGTWKNATVTIQNYLPVVKSVYISPSIVYDNSSLFGYCNISDPDGNSQNYQYNYKWYKNGVLNSSGSLSNLYSMEFKLANKTYLTSGDNWTFSCKANDGINNTNWMNSTQKTIIAHDTDGDGFNHLVDCNDNSASVRPPTDGEVLTNSVTYCPGNYNLDHGITINANNVVVNCNNTKFVGNRSLNAVSITSRSGTQILGCKFNNYSSVLNQNLADYTTIKNAVMNNSAGYGVYSTSSAYLNVTNSLIDHTGGTAIYSAMSPNAFIKNNLINNSGSYGIHFPGGSGSSIIRNNTIDRVGGTSIYDDTSNTLIEFNKISNSIKGLYTDCGNGGLIFRNNTIRKTSTGIHTFCSSVNAKIYNNIIRDTTDYAINLDGIVINNVHNNYLLNGTTAIYTQLSSDQVNISYNVILNFTNAGVVLNPNDAVPNLVEHNIFTNMPYAIYIISINSINFASYNHFINTNYGVYLANAINYTASYNYWQTTDKAVIPTKIYDNNDNGAYGYVSYCPFIDQNNNVIQCNVAPVTLSSRISPSTAYDNDTLKGYCNATDADGDSLTYNYKWYKNGVNVTSGSRGTYAQATERYIANITTSNLVVGDNWKFSCKANDGQLEGTWKNSSIITIQDACTPSWQQHNTSCSIYNNLTTWQDDNNNCFASTGLSSDNNVPINVTHSCNYCSYNPTNTSWTSWTDVSCLDTDYKNQTRTRKTYDANYATCYAITGIGTDLWNGGVNITHTENRNNVDSCNYCSYGVTNTSWTNWNNLTCLKTDFMNQTRSRKAYDANYATCYAVTGIGTDLWNGGVNITYTENRNNVDSCNYCSYSVTNSTWTQWNNVSCLNTNFMNQTRTRHAYDANYATCYTLTGILSDRWNGGVNITYTENRNNVVTCDYCTPALANTSWSGWSNVGCSNGVMNRSRSLVQYDTNNCGEIANTTFVSYGTVGPSFLNTSWTAWSNVSCLNTNFMNQTRTRVQYDSYSCASNTTFRENRNNVIACDYCTPVLANTTASVWSNVSCLVTNLRNQSRSWTQYDTNNCGEVANVTYFGFRQTQACDYCTPSWNEVNTSCRITDTKTGWYNDTNYCFAITGIGTDNLPPANNSYSCNYAAPVVNSVSVSPVSPSDIQNIVAYCNATDSASTSLTYNYKWYKNGILNISGSKVSTLLNTKFNVVNLSSTLTTTGDVWKFSCQVNDGGLSSTYVNSSNINIASSCVEDWVANYESCTLTDTRIKYYVDQNLCGTLTGLPGDNGTSVSCNYCSYSITNSTWTQWNNVSCLNTNFMNQTRTRHAYDANYATCYALTGIGTDLWNSGVNITYTENRNNLVVCDYCTPSLTNTTPTSWANVSCLVSNTMNQTRHYTRYDQNNCGEIANSTIVQFRNTLFCDYALLNAVDNDGDSYSSITDCNDANASIHPGAVELCNGVDDDCDSVLDGSEGLSQACGQSNVGICTYGTEQCNNAGSWVNCNAVMPTTEIANDGIDQNCDGSDLIIIDIDVDDDGYNNTVDCNDTNSLIHPGAIEIANDGIDQDCSGADLIVSVAVDNDGDGYNNTVDCNDANASIHPGAVELCNGVDDDCDSVLDGSEGLSQACGQSNVGICTYGTEQCNNAGSWVNCNAVMPTTEIANDGIDQNCDGSDLIVVVAVDNDGDGYNNTVDCDDSVASCNTDCTTLEYYDGDGDGFGYNLSSHRACDASTNYVSDDTDCNDASNTIYPGATEIENDGIDQDCNGADLVVIYDSDGDGIFDNVDLCNNQTRLNIPTSTTCKVYSFNSLNGCHAIQLDQGTTICNASLTGYICKDGNAAGDDVFRRIVNQYCGVNTGLCNGELVSTENYELFDQCSLSEYCVDNQSTCQLISNPVFLTDDSLEQGKEILSGTIKSEIGISNTMTIYKKQPLTKVATIKLCSVTKCPKGTYTFNEPVTYDWAAGEYYIEAYDYKEPIEAKRKKTVPFNVTQTPRVFSATLDMTTFERYQYFNLSIRPQTKIQNIAYVYKTGVAKAISQIQLCNTTYCYGDYYSARRYAAYNAELGQSYIEITDMSKEGEASKYKVYFNLIDSSRRFNVILNKNSVSRGQDLSVRINPKDRIGEYAYIYKKGTKDSLIQNIKVCDTLNELDRCFRYNQYNFTFNIGYNWDIGNYYVKIIDRAFANGANVDTIKTYDFSVTESTRPFKVELTKGSIYAGEDINVTVSPKTYVYSNVELYAPGTTRAIQKFKLCAEDWCSANNYKFTIDTGLDWKAGEYLIYLQDSAKQDMRTYVYFNVTKNVSRTFSTTLSRYRFEQGQGFDITVNPKTSVAPLIKIYKKGNSNSIDTITICNEKTCSEEEYSGQYIFNYDWTVGEYYLTVEDQSETVAANKVKKIYFNITETSRKYNFNFSANNIEQGDTMRINVTPKTKISSEIIVFKQGNSNPYLRIKMCNTTYCYGNKYSNNFNISYDWPIGEYYFRVIDYSESAGKRTKIYNFNIVETTRDYTVELGTSLISQNGDFVVTINPKTKVHKYAYVYKEGVSKYMQRIEICGGNKQGFCYMDEYNITINSTYDWPVGRYFVRIKDMSVAGQSRFKNYFFNITETLRRFSLTLAETDIRQQDNRLNVTIKPKIKIAKTIYVYKTGVRTPLKEYNICNTTYCYGNEYKVSFYATTEAPVGDSYVLVKDVNEKGVATDKIVHFNVVEVNRNFSARLSSSSVEQNEELTLTLTPKAKVLRLANVYKTGSKTPVSTVDLCPTETHGFCYESSIAKIKTEFSWTTGEYYLQILDYYNPTEYNIVKKTFNVINSLSIATNKKTKVKEKTVPVVNVKDAVSRNAFEVNYKVSSNNVGVQVNSNTGTNSNSGSGNLNIATVIDNDKDGYASTVDCNDNNALIHPGATETANDGIDQDCNGADLVIRDTDGDGVLDNADLCNDQNRLNIPASTSCKVYSFNSQNGCHVITLDQGSSVCDVSSTGYICKDGNALGNDVFRKTVNKYCGVNTGLCNGRSVNTDNYVLFDDCLQNEYCIEGQASCQVASNPISLIDTSLEQGKERVSGTIISEVGISNTITIYQKQPLTRVATIKLCSTTKCPKGTYTFNEPVTYDWAAGEYYLEAYDYVEPLESKRKKIVSFNVIPTTRVFSATLDKTTVERYQYFNLSIKPKTKIQNIAYVYKTGVAKAVSQIQLCDTDYCYGDYYSARRFASYNAELGQSYIEVIDMSKEGEASKYKVYFNVVDTSRVFNVILNKNIISKGQDLFVKITPKDRIDEYAYIYKKGTKDSLIQKIKVCDIDNNLDKCFRHNQYNFTLNIGSKWNTGNYYVKLIDKAYSDGKTIETVKTYDFSVK